MASSRPWRPTRGRGDGSPAAKNDLEISVLAEPPLGPARIVTQARWHLVHGVVVQCNSHELQSLRDFSIAKGVIASKHKCMRRLTSPKEVPIAFGKDNSERSHETAATPISAASTPSPTAKPAAENANTDLSPTTPPKSTTGDTTASKGSTDNNLGDVSSGFLSPTDQETRAPQIPIASSAAAKSTEAVATPKSSIFQQHMSRIAAASRLDRARNRAASMPLPASESFAATSSTGQSLSSSSPPTNTRSTRTEDDSDNTESKDHHINRTDTIQPRPSFRPRTVTKGSGDAATPSGEDKTPSRPRRGSLLDNLSPSLRFASILLASRVKKSTATRLKRNSGAHSDIAALSVDALNAENSDMATFVNDGGADGSQDAMEDFPQASSPVSATQT